jgi:hypothetical protein
MLFVEFIDSEVIKAMIILMQAFTLFLFSSKKESRTFVPLWAKGVYCIKESLLIRGDSCERDE